MKKNLWIILLGSMVMVSCSTSTPRHKVETAPMRDRQTGDIELASTIQALVSRLDAQEELWRQLNHTLETKLSGVRQQLDNIQNQLAQQKREAPSRQGKHNEIKASKKTVPQRATGTRINNAKNKQNAQKDLGTQKKLFTAAYLKLKQGDFKGAQKDFSKYLIQYPHGKYASLAHFWLGEAYFATGYLNGAKGEFLKVGRENADKHARALWRLIQIAQQQQNREDVLRFSQLLLSSHPSSPEAEKVRALMQGKG